MNEGHIYIDGVISEDYHLKVRKQIENLGDVSKIILHIQSPGGSVYAGYNTYHVLKSSGKQIEAIIEGECQSIATFISLAADKIIARNPSVYMIHNPYANLEGDASAMENGANELRKIEDVMIKAYQFKTNLSVDQLREMMAKETSMTAEEAQRLGFVDEVKDHLRAVAVGKHKLKMENQFSNVFNEFGKKMDEVFNKMFGPFNLDVPLKDGTVLKVDVAEGEDMVGKQAMVDGQPAPVGEHEMADGSILVVGENGIIMEVRMPMPEVNPMEEMKKENEMLKTEIEKMKAEREALAAEAKAKGEQAFEVINTLKKEFNQLRKMTVGNPNPAPVAPVAQVKAAAEASQVADDTTAAFINEFLPHLKRK